MSPKWPASLFSYSPRVPVAAEAEGAPEPAPVPAEAPVHAETLSIPVEHEAELVERARTDPDAFGQLYELYVDRVYSYIYHRVGNVQDAEDLTARTFYRALEKLDAYEDRGLPFSAWLFRIAHNLVANWHRDHSRRQVFSLEKFWWRSSDDARPEHAVEADAEREELWDAINRLPEERRNLLLYKLNTTLSNLEIGELMNKSESAIKSLYFRTLAALRKDLEDRGWGAALRGNESIPSGSESSKDA
ncbi:MAG: sigma-70 family RNA polymerase sigma factor [Caldilinea sp.]